VVIGEQLGNFAPAEHQHRLYGAARRMAAPGARMMPSRYRFTFTAVRNPGLREDLARLRSIDGVDLSALAERLGARPAFVNVEDDDALGPTVEGPWIASDAPPIDEARAIVPVDRDGEVDAIAVGFTAELAPGVLLTTAIGAPRTHWSQSLFPIAPLPVKAGDELDVTITPRVITSVSTWGWLVTRGHDVREGDGMGAMIGENRDILDALEARPVGPLSTPALLRAWAAALGGSIGDHLDIDALARAAAAALPNRYPNVEEALQDVRALVAAAGKFD
jgi:hypothetical protein